MKSRLARPRTPETDGSEFVSRLMRCRLLTQVVPWVAGLVLLSLPVKIGLTDSGMPGGAAPWMALGFITAATVGILGAQLGSRLYARKFWPEVFSLFAQENGGEGKTQTAPLEGTDLDESGLFPGVTSLSSRKLENQGQLQFELGKGRASPSCQARLAKVLVLARRPRIHGGNQAVFNGFLCRVDRRGKGFDEIQILSRPNSTFPKTGMGTFLCFLIASMILRFRSLPGLARAPSLPDLVLWGGAALIFSRMVLSSPMRKSGSPAGALTLRDFPRYPALNQLFKLLPPTEQTLLGKMRLKIKPPSLDDSLEDLTALLGPCFSLQSRREIGSVSLSAKGAVIYLGLALRRGSELLPFFRLPTRRLIVRELEEAQALLCYVRDEMKRFVE